MRPLTPPLAFWASTRAWHAFAESSKFGAATPVPDQMNPSFTDLSLTPEVSLDWAPAEPAVSPMPSAITVTVHMGHEAPLPKSKHRFPPQNQTPDPSERPAGQPQP